MYFVYVIRSLKNGQNYVGMTNNIDRRLKEHNSGYNKSTKPYLPWKILFSEELPTRIEARNREKYLKSGIGREFINDKWPRGSTE